MIKAPLLPFLKAPPAELFLSSVAKRALRSNDTVITNGKKCKYF